MLYHYTGLNGFIGILQSSSIWATHTAYLNDSSEFVHALDKVKSVGRSAFMEDDYLAVFGWAVEQTMNQVIQENIFVASFSEKPDLLSQWRGYCPSGAGLCLGFESNTLEVFCKAQGYRFDRCVYLHGEQENHIRSLVDQCFKNFPCPDKVIDDYALLPMKERARAIHNYHILINEGYAKPSADKVLERLKKQIVEVAPLFKNQGFHEEAEWRVVAHNPSVPLKFRAAKSYLVPYIELLVFGESKAGVLKEVIIGPNPNQHRCATSVQQFLAENGFIDVEVKMSAIPYNSW